MRHRQLGLALLLAAICLAEGAGLGCGAGAQSAERTLPEAPPSAAAIASAPELENPEPETRREDIVETHFGVRVSDPYRWLERADDPEVVAWVERQNQHARAHLDSTGFVPYLQRRMRQLLEIGSLSGPTARKSSEGKLLLFYRRREGQQNQPVLLWRDGPASEPRTLLDVNAMDPAGTTALDYFDPSPDGALLAYGLSRDGSEESTLYVRDVRTGRDLPDVIARTRYASVCWQADGRGFFYTRYPEPGSVPKGEEQYHRTLYEHRLGTDPGLDSQVFGKGRPMTEYPSCSISPNGRWLVVSVHVGWNQTHVFLADTRKRPLVFQELTEQKQHTYGVLALDDALWIMTNEDAPRYALYRASPGTPTRKHWQLVLPEHPSNVLDHFNVIGGKLIASYSESAISRLERFDIRGKSLGRVPLPSLGSIGSIAGVHDRSTAFFDFESFLAPLSVHQLDVDTNTSSPLLSVPLPIDPGAFRVEQRSARSKDGTSIPFVVVARKDVALDSGDNPTLLHGYGGFNVSLSPRFSRTNHAFLERAGVYVQANLRGGGEFGESWHRAGQLEHKQNVFDDFFAVAEALIDSKLTRPERLAIYGRSNGGLLVAAALTQRPELFGAAVSAVPLTDMLRYPRFLIARLWTTEYGSPDDAEQFRWLYAYSPYHRVRAGTHYPATLFLTAESDTRVDPAHARKMTAALQAAAASTEPVLLRTEVKAGHGAGKPMLKVADEHADLYAFVMSALGMPAPEDD